jgi:hemerythrin-like domain-containing protein
MTTTILDQLKNEHKELIELFKKAQNCNGFERTDILKQIKKEIVPHSRGEEKTIYTWLKESIEQDDKATQDEINLANEAYEEHRLIDKMLKDLEGTNINDEMWSARLMVLKENVEHHIEEEEKELFKLIKKHFSNDKLEEIRTLYIFAKDAYVENLPSQSQMKSKEPINDTPFY